MQAEKLQNTSCVELIRSSGTQPGKPFALQEESISDAHSAGSPYASSIHLHDDVSQPLEHHSGNIGSVSASARFCAARAPWPVRKEAVAAVYSSNCCFISFTE